MKKIASARNDGIQTVRVEILRPASIAPAGAEALREIVKKQVAEILASRDEFVFQPFFQAKKVSDEIKRCQNVGEQRKWSIRYERLGCLDCKERTAPHRAMGMCANCYARIRAELVAIVREYRPGSEDEYKEFRSDEQAARKALTAHSEKSEVAKKTIRDEGRAAEQMGEREKAARDRLAAAREKRALRVEAQLQAKELRQKERARLVEIWRQANVLHEEGLTWREIAERLDPDFANDEDAAIARIMMGARRWLFGRTGRRGQCDRLAAAQEKRARRVEALLEAKELRHKERARFVEIWRQANALHEEGLTWREIAERLDPDFANGEDAAIARISMGARRWLFGRTRRRGPIAQQSWENVSD